MQEKLFSIYVRAERKVSNFEFSISQIMAEGGDVEKPSLTVEKLMQHDRATEEKECRYFACGKCNRKWWESVPKYKPVSQCWGCKTHCNAIPPDLEPKIGKHVCCCGNEFTGWTSEGVTSPCYKCGAEVLPEELQKPRPIKTKTDKTHNCSLCNGRETAPISSLLS